MLRWNRHKPASIRGRIRSNRPNVATRSDAWKQRWEIFLWITARSLSSTFYHEFSYEEIAQIMNCPVNTVKTRMFYAKKKIRESLSQSESRPNL